MTMISYLRYFIVRFTSCPLPIASNIWFIGDRTCVEILNVLAFMGVGVYLGAIFPSGRVADVIGGIAVLAAMRCNLATTFLGISFERALYWHKIFAVIFIATGLIHGTASELNGTGIFLISLMIIMSLAYIFITIIFEIFYYIHIIAFMVLIPVSAAHGCIFTPLACIGWAIDLLLRYCITGKKVTAEAAALPGDVIKIKFPNAFIYQPGQYCFLMIKTLSRFEYHPFSISSSPNEETTTFHIRALGDWTKQLQSTVLANQSTLQQHGLKTETVTSIPLEIFIEGPYGFTSVDFNDPSYKVFLFISGGIGITPLQSLYSNLIEQQANGRNIRKVVFIWTVKDKATVDALDASKLHPSVRTSHLPISFQPTMKPPPNRIYPFQDSVEDAEATMDHTESRQLSMGSQEVHAIGSARIFLADYYLTSLRNESDFAAANIHPAEQAEYIKFGRPNLSNVFSEVRDLCVKEGVGRVAVAVCGPQSLVNDVNDRCKQTHFASCLTIHQCLMNKGGFFGRVISSSSPAPVPTAERDAPSNSSTHSGGVVFDCHAEVFNF